MSHIVTPGGHGLGCIPDLPDQRDYVFAAAKIAAVPPVLPTKIDLRKTCPPIYDQGTLGSCTANAIGAAFDFDRKHQGKRFMTPSRLFIYWNERDIEGTTAEDAGANLRDGIKVVAGLGTPREVVWRYDVTQFAVKPPAKAYAAAVKNQALVYERLTPSAVGDTADMRACLAAGIPFVTGIVVYQSFEGDSAVNHGVVPLPAPGEPMLGGHAVAVVGYDDAARRFLCRNSWGKGWGKKGYFQISYDYLTNPQLAFDAWVIRTVEV